MASSSLCLACTLGSSGKGACVCLHDQSMCCLCTPNDATLNTPCSQSKDSTEQHDTHAVVVCTFRPSAAMAASGCWGKVMCLHARVCVCAFAFTVMTIDTKQKAAARTPAQLPGGERENTHVRVVAALCAVRWSLWLGEKFNLAKLKEGPGGVSPPIHHLIHFLKEGRSRGRGNACCNLSRACAPGCGCALTLAGLPTVGSP